MTAPPESNIERRESFIARASYARVQIHAILEEASDGVVTGVFHDRDRRARGRGGFGRAPVRYGVRLACIVSA
jgi:hypothetical protein